MTSGQVPLLLPAAFIAPNPAPGEWVPTRYLEEPQPPPVDSEKMRELELAAQRQLLDGKALKKTRPRRTVDYTGGLGKWALLSKLKPHPRYTPYLRPAAAYIVDLLPAKAYPGNASTSLCTKFVHTSTNKIRCPVNCVTWTPEARRVLTGSTSGEFTLWNGLTFNFETILQAHDSAIRAIEFNHSGTYLASGHRDCIRAVSFSPDDSKFATGGDDSHIKIWSFVESREERLIEAAHGWDVKSVEWHPTKGLIASGGKDNVVKFWDPRSATVLTTLHEHHNSIQALGWNPTGDLLASAARDSAVRIFDIRAMKSFAVLKGHKKEACSLTWHPIHPLLVTGGSDGSILHWDLSSVPSDPVMQSVSPRATLPQAHDTNVWALAFHPLGHILVSGSNDHTTRFWSRERPGGEKPPDMDATLEDWGEGDGALPGFAASAWDEQLSQQRQQSLPGLNRSAAGPGDDFIPGFSGDGAAMGLPGFTTGAGPSQPPAHMPHIPQRGGPSQGLGAPRSYGMQDSRQEDQRERRYGGDDRDGFGGPRMFTRGGGGGARSGGRDEFGREHHGGGGPARDEFGREVRDGAGAGDRDEFGRERRFDGPGQDFDDHGGRYGGPTY
ncbi:WD40-repeat-containing domain protein [Auriculariales sp. MPI-PUGE-AT-0066]|nr:WD40-repeat-containing domain protein [Auriculariales sp. MPI-PUGE-AT-0066]